MRREVVIPQALVGLVSVAACVACFYFALVSFLEGKDRAVGPFALAGLRLGVWVGLHLTGGPQQPG
jgi:hypothetical protein